MFYIKCKDIEERSKLIEFLKQNNILAVFHYIPLHSSPAGMKFGRFHGKDIYTTKESERLLRLPLYYGLKEEDLIKVCNKVKEFMEKIMNVDIKPITLDDTDNIVKWRNTSLF